MMHSPTEIMTTPRRDDLGLTRISNSVGLSISLLPNGAIFAIEHTKDGRTIVINRSLALPIGGGMGRLFLRSGGVESMVTPIIGAEARCHMGVAGDRFVWEGKQHGVHHKASLWLHPDTNLWLWRVNVVNNHDRELPFDTIFIQDLGLGEQGSLMNNEAYASQYLDHHIACHPHMKSVLMARQNLSQGGAYPWVAHGCIEGAAGFATDFRQLMGPLYRDGDLFAAAFGTSLPSQRLQYETACAALQSAAVTLPPGATTSWTFFGIYESDHPAASSDADLALIDTVGRAAKGLAARKVAMSVPIRSILQESSPAVADSLDERTIEARYPQRVHVERADDQLLSFFMPGDIHSRHIVLRDKERLVARRHGALLRSGAALLPDEATLCATCWMHGVFGAQLTIGNTSFHKLFSVSRDPYNITPLTIPQHALQDCV